MEDNNALICQQMAATQNFMNMMLTFMTSVSQNLFQQQQASLIGGIPSSQGLVQDNPVVNPFQRTGVSSQMSQPGAAILGGFKTNSQFGLNTGKNVMFSQPNDQEGVFNTTTPTQPVYHPGLE